MRRPAIDEKGCLALGILYAVALACMLAVLLVPRAHGGPPCECQQSRYDVAAISIATPTVAVSIDQARAEVLVRASDLVSADMQAAIVRARKRGVSVRVWVDAPAWVAPAWCVEAGCVLVTGPTWQLPPRVAVHIDHHAVKIKAKPKR